MSPDPKTRNDTPRDGGSRTHEPEALPNSADWPPASPSRPRRVRPSGCVSPRNVQCIAQRSIVGAKERFYANYPGFMGLYDARTEVPIIDVIESEARAQVLDQLTDAVMQDGLDAGDHLTAVLSAIEKLR